MKHEYGGLLPEVVAQVEATVTLGLLNEQFRQVARGATQIVELPGIVGTPKDLLIDPSKRRTALDAVETVYDRLYNTDGLEDVKEAVLTDVAKAAKTIDDSLSSPFPLTQTAGLVRGTGILQTANMIYKDVLGGDKSSK